MRKFFHDLFVPHLHNNFRARLLHHQSLVLSILFFLFGSFFLSTLRTNLPQVLGIATDITSEKLLVFTNEERQANGGGPLVVNNELTQAAQAKANNMFAEDYWAHNSPSGKTPWYFIKNSGYTYTYAGENLARGFTDSENVIKAWMASPTHRENMLSTNYKDVGFAVKEGRLNGEETVLIVEMFGNTSLSQNTSPGAASSPNRETLVLNSKTQNPLIDITSFSKNLTLIFGILFISILILDMAVVGRKNIVRFVGHNLDHILFLSIILLIIIVIARGYVL